MVLHNFFEDQEDLKVDLEGVAYSDYDIPAGRTPRFGPDYLFSDKEVMEKERKRKSAEKERVIHESIRVNSEIHRKEISKQRHTEDESTL